MNQLLELVPLADLVFRIVGVRLVLGQWWVDAEISWTGARPESTDSIDRPIGVSSRIVALGPSASAPSSGRLSWRLRGDPELIEGDQDMSGAGVAMERMMEAATEGMMDKLLERYNPGEERETLGGNVPGARNEG